MTWEPMREEPEYVPTWECKQKYRRTQTISITDKTICAGRGKADSCMVCLYKVDCPVQ